MEEISFIDALKSVLSPMLSKIGFEAIEEIIDHKNTIIYKRIRDNGTDQIWFVSSEGFRQFIIHDGASTSVGGGFGLKSLREFLPNWLDAPDWSYTNEATLQICVDEIQTIVVEKLLPWFMNPIVNPGGHDMSPIVQLTDSEMKANLELQIHIFSLALERAKAANDLQEIERSEFTLRLFQTKLDEINS